jgi:hypothetical protein
LLLSICIQNEISGSAEFDPDNLSQLTPLSSLKHSDLSKNWDTLSQLTPTSNNPIAELANDSPVGQNIATKHKSADAGPQTATHHELIPPKHSSSKRVKLIKQEKK